MVYNKEAVFLRINTGQEMKDSQGDLGRTSVLL